MPAKFVVKKGTTGKFRFNLLSTNGKVIATSETYETKRACLAGIESVRKECPEGDHRRPERASGGLALSGPLVERAS